MQVEYLHSKTDTNLTEELTLMITHLAKVKYTKNDDLTRYYTDITPYIYSPVTLPPHYPDL